MDFGARGKTLERDWAAAAAHVLWDSHLLPFSVSQRKVSSALLTTLQGVCTHFITNPETLLLHVVHHKGETEA